MISKKAANQLYDVIRTYVPAENIHPLLCDLRDRVPGNQSYRDTIREVLKLHLTATATGQLVKSNNDQG